MSEDNDNQQAHSTRFTAWSALMAFSAISLGALVSLLNTKEDNIPNYSKDSQDKWAISVTAVSLSISTLAVFGYFLMKAKFAGTKIEGASASLVLLFWIIGLPTIMDPDNDLATSPGNINANLYYFSWASFISSLFVSGHFAQEMSGGSLDVGKTPPKVALWLLFTASSFVVLGASSKLHDTLDCKNSSSDTCNRNKFAISIGAIGGVVGLVVLCMAKRNMIPKMFEMIVGVTVLILYGFGVAFITFGDGSGTQVGNLYYFTWISFVTTMVLAFGTFGEFWGGRKSGESEAAAEETKPEIEETAEGAKEDVEAQK